MKNYLLKIVKEEVKYGGEMYFQHSETFTKNICSSSKEDAKTLLFVRGKEFCASNDLEIKTISENDDCVFVNVEDADNYTNIQLIIEPIEII